MPDSPVPITPEHEQPPKQQPDVIRLPLLAACGCGSGCGCGCQSGAPCQCGG
ncbi:hypothetical protein [Streptomyces sp. NPDC048603]|uniref:hypothetical protein n=1 Tax=Streptomyces sp. NPDC048603 TaxID=3365577 RepID=UPI003711D11E